MKCRVHTLTGPINLPPDPVHRDFWGVFQALLHDIDNFQFHWSIPINASSLYFLLSLLCPVNRARFKVKVQRDSVLESGNCLFVFWAIYSYLANVPAVAEDERRTRSWERRKVSLWKRSSNLDLQWWNYSVTNYFGSDITEQRNAGPKGTKTLVCFE